MVPFRLTLNDAFKHFTADQDKLLSPEQTVTRLRQKLATLDLEILGETVRIDNGRLGIPVFLSRCGRDARAVTGTTKQMGKGATPAQAEASAVMELAERFSFFSFCHDARHFTHGTWAEMGPEALPFEQIALAVHDESEQREIARPFFERLPMRWCWGFSLTHGRAVRVPFDWFFAINEFNGPSAGNCNEEALVQGICEVAERHVSALVSQQRQPVPLLRPQSASDAAVRGMLEKYRSAGIELYLSDFTLGSGIPSVGVLAWDPATFPARSEIVWTAGTAPDPQKALSRALTEVAQLAGDFNTGANYVASGLPKPPSLEQVGFITQGVPERAIGELPNLAHNNMRLEVEALVGAMERLGLEVIVLDVRHPRLDVPAFYTIVPGAHFRERALATSVGLFTAKLMVANLPAEQALAELSAFDRALPGTYWLQFYIGQLLLDAGRPAEAQSHLERALALGPNSQDRPSVYSYLGMALRDQGRFDQALPLLEQGLALDAERVDLLNLAGVSLYKLGRYEEAIARFREVLAITPGSAMDLANIGVCYRAMGQREPAIAHFQLALGLDDSIEFARQGLEQFGVR